MLTHTPTDIHPYDVPERACAAFERCMIILSRRCAWSQMTPFTYPRRWPRPCWSPWIKSGALTSGLGLVCGLTFLTAAQRA